MSDTTNKNNPTIITNYLYTSSGSNSSGSNSSGSNSSGNNQSGSKSTSLKTTLLQSTAVQNYASAAATEKLKRHFEVAEVEPAVFVPAPDIRYKAPKENKFFAGFSEIGKVLSNIAYNLRYIYRDNRYDAYRTKDVQISPELKERFQILAGITPPTNSNNNNSGVKK